MLSRKNYHENGHLLGSKLNFTDSKTLKESTSIYSEILACFPFVYRALFYFFSNVIHNSTHSFFLNEVQIIAISTNFVLLFKNLHVFTCFQQFLFILCQTF